MRFSVPMNLLWSFALFSTACSGQKVRYDCDPCETEIVKQSYVHKYGIEVPKQEWGSRGENGKIVSTLKSGVIVTKNYTDGYLEGDTTYTFPHSGAIQKIETFQSGRLVKAQEMYSTGNVKKEVLYEAPNKKLVAMWYENGAPFSREEYHDDKLLEGDYYTTNNQIESRVNEGEGLRTNRDEFGQLVSKDKFLYGQKMMTTLYYPNGAPKEVIPYQQGKIDGQRKTFLPGGEPVTVEGWTNDKQEGITLVYQHGEKIAEVPYLNGYKNGVEHRFKDGRFLVEEINWNNGKRQGPSYVHVGEDTIVSWFYDGQEVPKGQYDRLMNPKPR